MRVSTNNIKITSIALCALLSTGYLSASVVKKLTGIQKKPLIISPKNSKDLIRLQELKSSYASTQTYFKTNIDITWSIFNKSFDFYGNQVLNHFSVDRNRFENDTQFLRNQFDNKINLENNLFNSSFDLSFNKILSSANFRNNIFKGHASFNNNIFAGPTQFSGSQFNSKTYFKWNLFKDHVDLSNITVGAPLSFEGSIFYKSIDFSNTTNISQKIDLRQAHAGSSDNIIFINLAGAKIENILINYDYFKLYFPQGTPDKLKIKTYKALLAQFKANGLDDSWKKLYREYKSFSYQSSHQYLLNSLHSFWSDYGLEKQRVFDFMLILIVICFILNTIFFDKILKYGIEAPFLAYDKSVEGKEFRFLRIIRNIPASLFFTFYLFFASIVKLGSNLDNLIKNRSIFMAAYVTLCAFIGFGWLLLIIEYGIKGNVS